VGSALAAVFEPATRHENSAANGYRRQNGPDRLGLTIDQPVNACHADENTEAFTDRQVVGKCHQAALLVLVC